jgi:hypothetical protein
MTGEVLALTQCCEIVKNVFQQDHSERPPEAGNPLTLRV